MEIYSDEKCCGCGLCIAVCPENAIKFTKNPEGFLYPEIEQTKCVDCGLCKRICNFNKKTLSDNVPIESLAIKAKDDGLREKSSSGGVFPLVARSIIKNLNGVVYGAAYIPSQNMKVMHIRVDDESDIQLLQGSKYVQSDIGNSYANIEKDLKQGKYVLFCGTPCQVAALKEYTTHKKTKTDTLVTCEFVCHGVPSPGLWNEYIKILEKKNKSKVIGYDFRYKDENCPWGEVNVCAEFEDRKDVNSLLTRAFINLYFDNVITRPSCTECSYTSIHRNADITLADCWGIEDSIPNFADRLGVSFVLVNTPKGSEIFGSVKEFADFKDVDAQKLRQPHLKSPCKASDKRAKVWEDYSRYGLLKVMKKYTELNFLFRVKRFIIKQMVNVYHLVLRVCKKDGNK